jgi:4-carboxymuconolactone decarboxylase
MTTAGDRFVPDQFDDFEPAARGGMKGIRMADVAQDTHEVLSGISVGDASILDTAIGMRELGREVTGLDGRTYALVKIAALIALDAPPASYAWQIGNALDEGVTPEDILGVLRAVAFQVGGPKVVAAAPEIMLALGLALPEEV